MVDRKAGYYWVKDGLGWEPLRWSGCVWDGHVNDDDLQEVGQRIPEPDEPWQCVPVEPTDDMAWDGLVAYTQEFKKKGTISPTRAAYAAMLAAAPKPED